MTLQINKYLLPGPVYKWRTEIMFQTGNIAKVSNGKQFEENDKRIFVYFRLKIM